MKKLFLGILLLSAWSISVFGQATPPIRLEEIDGNPSVLSPTRIKVSNGTLSCTGKVCTLTIGTGTGNVTAGGTLTSGKIIIGGGTTAVSASKVTLTDPATTATLTLADNSSLITSGANAVTITSTGTTNSTLPSGTHTLSGLDVAETLSGVKTFTAAPIVGLSSATAFTVAPNTAGTNPTFQVVTNVASAATGLSIQGNAAGAGVRIQAISSGTNEDMVFVPKGSGSVKIGNTVFVPIPDTLLTLGNNAGSMAIQLGQDATHNMFMQWAYNATPANAYLNLQTFGNDNPIRIGAVATGGVFINTDTANGDVGIGTTSPTARLHLAQGSMLIGSGSIGTSGVSVLAIGGSTAPSTRPADEAQAWVTDWNGAGTAAFFFQGEEATATYSFGSSFVTPPVKINGGATIQKVLTGTASLNFGATAAGACDTLTITVTGAADGDVVILGIPNALAASDNYQQFSGYVNAADTVTVKRCNLTNTVTALSDPAAATVRATVVQF